MPRITPLHYYKRLIKIFGQAGFRVSRTKGHHVVMVKPENPRPLIIPKWQEVPVFIILEIICARLV